MTALALLATIMVSLTGLTSDGDGVSVSSDPTGITTVVTDEQPAEGQPSADSLGSATNSVTCTWRLDDGLNRLLAQASPGTDLAIQYAAGGRFYDIECSDGSLTLGAYVGPGGVDPSGPVTSQGLALIARSRLPLPAPRAGHNPVGDGLVGLATWWWVPRSQWRLLRQRTEAGPVWAVVSAQPVSSTWDPGDGSAPLTCAGPGTVYDQSRAAASQQTRCAHTYRASSAGQPQTGPGVNDRFYIVTVTVTWRVSWRGSDGSSGVLPAITRTSQFPLRVSERQALVTDAGE